MHVMDRHRHRTVACAACVRMRCAFTHAMKMCSVDESDHLKKNGLEQTYFSLRPLSGLIILWLCFIAIQLAVLIQFYELILGGKFSGQLTYNIRVWIKQNRDFCFSSSISQLVLFIYLLFIVLGIWNWIHVKNVDPCRPSKGNEKNKMIEGPSDTHIAHKRDHFLNSSRPISHPGASHSEPSINKPLPLDEIHIHEWVDFYYRCTKKKPQPQIAVC